MDLRVDNYKLKVVDTIFLLGPCPTRYRIVVDIKSPRNKLELMDPFLLSSKMIENLFF